MGQPEFYATAYGNNAVEPAALNVRTRAPYRIRHRRVFIGLISTILILCFAHLALGIFVSVVIYPNTAYHDPVANETYSAGSLFSRVRLIFFWITIPAVLTLLSLYEFIQICRNRLPSKWIAISAICAGVIWGVQMTLEGICMWNFPSSSEFSDAGLCPWWFSTNNGWNEWTDAAFTAWITPWVVIPVICMYIVHFSVGMRAIVIDKRDRKEQAALAEAPKEDSLSLHTLSTSPVAETLVTDTLHPSTRGVTRPPSYFSSSAGSFDSYDVKKD